MKVGVTGNFASGKGTVCSMFAELGAHIIDTDKIARDIVQPGSPVLQKIRELFGDDIIDDCGFLKRRVLANRVFGNNEKVFLLNSLTHPAILAVVEKLCSDAGQIYMINTPLLFESGFDHFMDVTVTVSASSDQSIKRGIARDGLSAKDIELRLSHQISLNEKVEKATM